MSPRSLVLLGALAFAATACAHSGQEMPAPTPPPSPAVPPPSGRATPPEVRAVPAVANIDASGTYDFTTQVQGQDVSGTINIVSRNGEYSGVISTNATPDMAIASVTVKGSLVTVIADSGQGDVVLEFTVTGQDIDGRWSLGGDAGTFRGRKRG